MCLENLNLFLSNLHILENQKKKKKSYFGEQKPYLLEQKKIGMFSKISAFIFHLLA
jgi:hypothetical protein